MPNSRVPAITIRDARKPARARASHPKIATTPSQPIFGTGRPQHGCERRFWSWVNRAFTQSDPFPMMP